MWNSDLLPDSSFANLELNTLWCWVVWESWEESRVKLTGKVPREGEEFEWGRVGSPRTI